MKNCSRNILYVDKETEMNLECMSKPDRKESTTWQVNKLEKLHYSCPFMPEYD